VNRKNKHNRTERAQKRVTKKKSGLMSNKSGQTNAKKKKK